MKFECPKGHPLQATVKLDAELDADGKPTYRFGELNIYCEEDCDPLGIGDRKYNAVEDRFRNGVRECWQMPARVPAPEVVLVERDRVVALLDALDADVFSDSPEAAARRESIDAAAQAVREAIHA